MLLDPGIGFGKTVEHNLELLRRLDELAAHRPPDRGGHLAQERSWGASAAGAARARSELARDAGHRNVLAFERGASVFRVHDVAPVRDALAVAAATLGGRWTRSTEETTPTS